MPAGWSASPTERPFLIAAASARALAASAARAGYRIRAIDLFADSDLDAAAEAWARVPRRAGGGFQTRAFLSAVAHLAPCSGPRFGFVYGSGFEDRPELLDRIARHCAVYGNGAGTLRLCKDPVRFADLLDELALPRPAVRAAPPPAKERKRWLAKRAGGSGGIHIRDAAKARGGRGIYFQRYIAGTPVSATLLGDGKRARVLGLAVQTTAPTPAMPFRFGGLAAPAGIPPALARKLSAAARKIASCLKLCGLASVDFVVDGDRFHVIETNPRPGASCDVFERVLGVSVFDLHVRACAGELPDEFETRGAAASRILYADAAGIMGRGFDWPEWSADRPRTGTVIGADEPVCTVFGSGRDCKEAQNLADSRSEALRARLMQCMESPARQEAALPLHHRGKRQEGKRGDKAGREHSQTGEFRAKELAERIEAHAAARPISHR